MNTMNNLKRYFVVLGIFSITLPGMSPSALGAAASSVVAPVVADSSPIFYISSDHDCDTYKMGEYGVFTVNLLTEFNGADGSQEAVVRGTVGQNQIAGMALDDRVSVFTTPKFMAVDTGEHDFNVNIFIRSKARANSLREAIRKAGSSREELIKLHDSTDDPQAQEYYQLRIDELGLVINEYYRQLENILTVVASGNLRFKVNSVKPVSIVVSPAAATITEGGMQNFAADGEFPDGHHENITSVSQWSAVNPSIVAPTQIVGQFTAVAPGNTVISASFGGTSGIASITVVPAIDPVCGNTAGLQQGSPWPMWRRCPSNNSRTMMVGPDAPEVKWSFTTGGEVRTTPVIAADGTIYFGSLDGKFYALNPDGTQKWFYQAGEQIWSSAAIGTDGTVYFGSHDHKLYALNPDGTQKWSFTVNQPILSAVNIAGDGTIYFIRDVYGNDPAVLFAVHPDGTEKWRYTLVTDLSMRNMASLSVGQNGTIYVGGECGHLLAINPDGTLKWDYIVGDNPGGHPYITISPAVDPDGTVYFWPGAANNTRVHAINSDSTLKWRSENMNMSGLMTFSFGDDRSVYISDGGGIIILSPLNGQQGGFIPDGNLQASPLISGPDQTVYFGNVAGTFYAARHDYSIKWSLPVSDSGLYSSPSMGADGTIYVGSNNGKVIAIGQAGKK
ncbi:MAG: hypothetical protein A2583_06915 [Bdellovibrionales bacterium RIFOXYD1_FULL_53_11]|nr:MAG: hypothetical protein A2583_06915 [Bdellovibrionales bacterium RIFOXYD1_FULL_53_11]